MSAHWSRDRTQVLRYLWSKGWCLDAIGAEMNMSRGAISGKLWRMKLTGVGCDGEHQRPDLPKRVIMAIIVPPSMKPSGPPHVQAPSVTA